MRRFIAIFLLLLLLTASLGISALADDPRPEPDPAPVESVEPEADSGFQSELLTVLTSMYGLMIFFMAALVFWACYKFIRIFF